ncbi:MAG TPA: aldose 1-epimerase [bacterium]|nr:aldose 1-epimerase [bacterium]
MYKLDKLSDEPVIFSVTDQEDGQSMTFSPDFGGNIMELKLRSDNGELISVIDGYSKPKELKQNQAYKSSLLFPFAGRIPDGKYNYTNTEYQFNIDDDESQAALHGCFDDHPFEIDSQDEEDDSFRVRMSSEYVGNHSGYPFHLELKLEYNLVNQRLNYRFETINRDDCKVPVSFGIHTYFQLSEKINDLLINISADEKVELDPDQLIPTGKTFDNKNKGRNIPIMNSKMNNVYEYSVQKGTGETRLINPKKNVSLTLSQETGGDKLNYLIVFTSPDRKSIAIEPLSSNINALNTGDGLIELDPGETFCGQFSIMLH